MPLWLCVCVIGILAKQRPHAHVMRRYCGNLVELVNAANKKGVMTKEAVRRWLEARPQVLEDMGITEDQLRDYYQIDHIIAQKVGGMNHPYNYFVMHGTVNNLFKQFYTQDKLTYLGPAARCAAQFATWITGQVEKKLADLVAFDKFPKPNWL